MISTKIITTTGGMPANKLKENKNVINQKTKRINTN